MFRSVGEDKQDVSILVMLKRASFDTMEWTICAEIRILFLCSLGLVIGVIVLAIVLGVQIQVVHIEM